MPNLNDYIGSIVSSITNARVSSDIQTVIVAEKYAKHNLLKHFSVPRMRIDDIEMTIPIALDELIEKTEIVYEPINRKRFNSLVYDELVNNFGLEKLPIAISKKLKERIQEQTEKLESNLKISNDLSILSDYTKDITLFSLQFENEIPNKQEKIKRVKKIDEMPKHLEKILSNEFKMISERKKIENLNVIVEASKLREQKPENIIYIKLKVKEDGMEWNRSENVDGEIESKLLPE